MKLWAQLTEWFTKKKTIAGRDRTIQILLNALESEKKVTRLLRQQVSTNDKRITGLTSYSKWSLRFHDFTSRRAWPRSVASFVFSAEDEEMMDVLRQHLRTQGKSFLTEGRPTPEGYEYRVKVLA